MLLVVELSARDEAAAANAARLVDDYLETQLGSGLLKFRIARQAEHQTHLLLLEEWTDAAASRAHTANAAFAAFARELATLLVEPPRPNAYEIVAAGVTSE